MSKPSRHKQKFSRARQLSASALFQAETSKARSTISPNTLCERTEAHQQTRQQLAEAEVLFQQAQAFHHQGELAQAVRLYQDVLKIRPDDVLMYFHLGNALRDLAHLDDAEASYRRALEIEPAFITAWNNLGTVLKDLKRIDEAMVCYRRALELKPDYALAHNNWAAASFVDTALSF